MEIKLTTPQELCDRANSMDSGIKSNKDDKCFKFFYKITDRFKAFFLQIKF